MHGVVHLWQDFFFFFSQRRLHWHKIRSVNLITLACRGSLCDVRRDRKRERGRMTDNKTARKARSSSTVTKYCWGFFYTLRKGIWIGPVCMFIGLYNIYGPVTQKMIPSLDLKILHKVGLHIISVVLENNVDSSLLNDRALCSQTM